MRISDWSSDVCSSDLDLIVAAHHVGETVDPGFVGVSVHPFDPAFDRRMVHDDIGGFRPVPGQFGVEPGRPGVAKGAAVASFLQRVDGDEAQFGQVDRILNEAVAVGPARKAAQRSEEHTSELQSLMSITYYAFCLTQNKKRQ